MLKLKEVSTTFSCRNLDNGHTKVDDRTTSLV